MRPPESWGKARLTLAIALATLVAWVLPWLFQIELIVAAWGAFWPDRPPELAYLPLWLTPLTATLIHAGPAHLAFNLVVLLFCGRPVESVLGPIGLAVLYVLGAFAAAGAQFALSPAVPMVGASGAVSAVIGAYAMLFGRNKVKVASPRLALLLNALWLLVAWIGLNLMLGIIMRGGLIGGAEIQVAVGAHIGGFVVGLVLATPLLLFRYRKA
jgi:membrane associated rhomboid family serine protease